MMRITLGTAAVLSLYVAGSATAADYPELRPAYEQGWENPDDSLRFEFGTAYWYSWGGQDVSMPASVGAVQLGNISLNSRDVTHLGELHGKIEDLGTQTYLSARAGLGFSTTGTYNFSPAGSGNIERGSRIGYAGADFGWLPLGTMENGAAVGGLIGYQYWKDAPEIGTGLYATSFAGGVPAS